MAPKWGGLVVDRREVVIEREPPQERPWERSGLRVDLLDPESECVHPWGHPGGICPACDDGVDV